MTIFGIQYSPKYTIYKVHFKSGLDYILAFKVEDLDKTLKEAQSNGYTIIQEITVDGGRWAYIEDPNGIWIALF